MMSVYEDRLENVGEAIVQARAHRGISQGSLAERSGIHTNTITKIERGYTKPRPTTLYRLARGLGVSVEDLLSGNVEPDQDPGQAADHGLSLGFENAIVLQPKLSPTPEDVYCDLCGQHMLSGEEDLWWTVPETKVSATHSFCDQRCYTIFVDIYKGVFRRDSHAEGGWG